MASSALWKRFCLAILPRLLEGGSLTPERTHEHAKRRNKRGGCRRIATQRQVTDNRGERDGHTIANILVQPGEPSWLGSFAHYFSPVPSGCPNTPSMS